MTTRTVNELRLAVDEAKQALKDHIARYGYDDRNPVQWVLENGLAQAQAALYEQTGEVTLHE